MNQQLLAIETAFLQRAEIKTALNIKAIKTLQVAIGNGQKKKFDQSLQLSKAVLEAVNWYRSTEGQSSLNESGITWTTEQFGQKVFGWQRSFFYKMIKVGGLETEKVDNFKTACDTLEASGKDANRTIEGLIKFANGANATTEGEGEGEGEGEEGASVERVETIFTLTYKREEGNVSVRIASDGTIKTTNDKEAIQAAIDFLTTQLSNG